MSGTLSLKSIEGDNGAVKAETCGSCRSYAKLLYEAQDTRVDPFADDLAISAYQPSKYCAEGGTGITTRSV